MIIEIAFLMSSATWDDQEVGSPIVDAVARKGAGSRPTLIADNADPPGDSFLRLPTSPGGRSAKPT